MLADSLDRIISGICHQLKDTDVVQLEGIVVARVLRCRGLRRAMEEEFCSRMALQGVAIVRAHFGLQNFYHNLGYFVDKRWGTLVKFLSSEHPGID